MLDFVMYLEKENRFNDFIKVRKSMEEILINYEFLVQQIVRKYRQSNVTYKNIKNYYITIINNLLLDKSINDTIEIIINSKEFSYLTTALKNEEEIKSKKISNV